MMEYGRNLYVHDDSRNDTRDWVLGLYSTVNTATHSKRIHEFSRRRRP